MQPDSRELLGLAAEIYLGIEKLTHCLVIELDTDRGDFLLDCDEVLYEQQVIRIGDAETAHFIARLVPEIQELGPRRGAEA